MSLPSTIGDPIQLMARARARGLISAPEQLNSPWPVPARQPHQIGRPRATRERPSYYIGFRTKPVTSDVLDIVGDWYGISTNLIKARGRKASVVWARHVTLYILQTVVHHTDAEAGSQLGFRRDLAGYAKRRVQRLREIDPAIDADLTKLINHVRAASSPSVSSAQSAVLPKVAAPLGAASSAVK